MTANDFLIFLGTNPAHWTPDQISGLTPRQISGLTPRQLSSLAPRQISRLTPDQTSCLTPHQFSCLTPDQISGLTPDQISGLTPDQIRCLIPSVPTLDQPYTKVWEATQGCSVGFDMGSWHRCETTHCLGGWLVVLAGAQELEAKGTTPGAAARILRQAHPDWPLPNFYAGDAEAKAFIKAMAAKEQQA